MTNSVHINRSIPIDAWNNFKKANKYGGLFLPVIVHDFEFDEDSDFFGNFMHEEHGNLTPASDLDVIYTYSDQKDPLTVGIIVWRNQEYTQNTYNGPRGTSPVIVDSNSYGYFLCPEKHRDRITTLISALKDTVTYIKVDDSDIMIEEETFIGYTELQTVNLANVEVVGNSAFYECKSLHKLIGGKALRILGDYCFSGCALVYVLLGYYIEYIGKDAFWYHEWPTIEYVAFDRNRTKWMMIDNGSDVTEERVHGGDWERPDIADDIDTALMLRRELQYRPLQLDAILLLGLHYLYEDEGIIEWIDRMADVFPSYAVHTREEIISMVILKHLK